MSAQGNSDIELDKPNDSLHTTQISNNSGFKIDNGEGSLSDSETEIADDMDPKQRLAVTLMNWSSIADNDHHMLQVRRFFSQLLSSLL